MFVSSRARRRAGFTLIETIVTVGLLAVLAAFVIPTVIQKSGAGDPVKVTNDLAAIRTGLETFSNDTKAGFPNEIWELTNKPSTTNKLIDGTTSLAASQVALWNGPYLSATIGSALVDSLPTGYTGFIKNQLQRYDAVNNAGEVAGGSGTFDSTATLFAAVKIVGLTTAQAATINKMIDGPDDLNVPTGQPHAGANLNGQFRFDAPDVNGLVVAYYMAVPVTK